MVINQTLLFVLIGVGAFVLGSLVAWILMRQNRHIAVADREAVLKSDIAELSQALAAAQEKNSRIPDLEMANSTAAQEARAYRDQHAKAAARIAALETQLDQERKVAAEKLAVLDEAQVRFSDAFKALSAEALRHNNSSFLELAKSTLEKTQETAKGDLAQRQSAIDALVKPMRESLEKVDAKIHDLETARAGAYEALKSQVQSLADTQNHLRSETGNLVRALRAPHVRGRWGEIQLRRVVELAGMVAHCDFVEQPTLQTEDGRLRPDLIVHPPGGKTIVVDAKTPLNAYLEALEAPDDETRVRLLDQHAAQVRTHIEKLSRKAYTEQFDDTPDFIVLVPPGEVFFSAALKITSPGRKSTMKSGVSSNCSV